MTGEGTLIHISEDLNIMARSLREFAENVYPKSEGVRFKRYAQQLDRIARKLALEASKF